MSRGVVGQMAATPWPYRAVTAPITTLLSLYLVAGVVDFFGVPWHWVLIVGIFLTVTAGMASVASAMGRAAAVYTVVTTVLSAVWMAYIAAHTPYSVAAIGSLIAGGLLIGPFFGVLRYAHRVAQEDDRPAEVVEAENSRDPWVKIFAQVGYRGSLVERDDSPDYGYRLNVQVKGSGNPLSGDLAGKLEQAAAALLTGDERLKRGAITVEAGEFANDIIVHVNTLDVFSDDLVPPTGTGPKSIKDPIELGRYIDGMLMEVTLPRDLHMTIVGQTGSGKSVLLNNLIRGVTQCVDAITWLSATDKGLPIVGPWLYPYATEETKHPLLDWASIDIEESARMLLSLYKLVHLRSSKPRGIKSKLEISASSPAVVAIFEEAPGLLRDARKWPTHNGRAMSASEIVNEITRLGRSEAVYVIVLSQYGTGEMLGADGPKMKANFGARAGLRTSSSRENQYVFPDDTNVHLHRLTNPGEIFLKTRVTPKPKFGRGYALEDESVADIALTHSRYKPSMEADIAAGLGKDYTERWSDQRAGALIDAIRFGTPVEVGSSVMTENKPETPAGLPGMPPAYKPPTKPADDREGRLLPSLPPQYQPPQKNNEPGPDDVERMFTEMETMLKAQRPQLTDGEKRIKLVEMLREAGTAGIRTSELQTRLQEEGAYPARGTFFRWLGEMAVQVKHGVWAINQEQEK